MAYLGKSPSQGVRNRYYFTASGGETSISGAITGGTLTFSDGNYVDVTLNGVTLVAGTDYNTSTANTIAGLTALTASDVVEIVVYDVFSVFSGNVNSDFSVGGNLTVDGNVGIGNSSPDSFFSGARNLVVGSGTGNNGMTIYSGTSNIGNIKFADGTGSDAAKTAGGIRYDHSGGFMRFDTNDGSERLRIDSSGNLLVGTTSTISSNTNGGLYVSNNGYTSLFNRESAAGDGNIMLFAKGGTTVGSIASTTRGGATDIFIGSGDTGIYFTQALDAVAPSNQGSDRDAAIDLGRSANRFKDLYLSGTVTADALTVDGTGTSHFTSTATSPVQINGTSIPTLTVRNSTTPVEAQIRATTTEGLVRTATNHPLVFATNASEAMRISSTGAVAINNTIPDSFYAGGNNLVVGSGSGSEGITIYGGAESNIFFADGTAIADNLVGRIEYSHGTNGMLFYTNNSYAMRIDSSGNLLHGISSTGSVGSSRGIILRADSGSQSYIQISNTGTSDTGVAYFYNGNGLVGTIRTENSATSYNTSSDYRLKENVTYDWDATTRLKQLKPARFNFIANADITVDGFLAHEAQTVVPEAVTGTHNEVDDDGNPVMQGIDQSKLVPLLVKTIQELEARITALEAE